VINCDGDYVNPTNKLCSDVVQTINDVSLTHYPKCLKTYILSICLVQLRLEFVVVSSQLKSEVDKQGILDLYVPLLRPDQGEMP
jgi:hypothetical protein